MSADKRQDSIEDVGVFTSTTEALSLTILTELLRRTSAASRSPERSVASPSTPSTPPSWTTGTSSANTSTRARRSFWVPDGFFGGADDALDLTAVGKGVSAGETLFINTYLVGVTTFAEAGGSEFARYSAEVAGDESEHRVLGQTLAGASPPNNLGFEEFAFDNVSDIEAAFVGAGFGFGQEGTSPGRFYDFPDPPVAAPIAISSNEPT